MPDSDTLKEELIKIAGLENYKFLIVAGGRAVHDFPHSGVEGSVTKPNNLERPITCPTKINTDRDDMIEKRAICPW
jgi:hypothetical protein